MDPKKGKHHAFRVALMLKAKGAYGRNIIEGACDYLKSTRLMWDLLLEEDFRSGPESLLTWSGDGIIADLDDPVLAKIVYQSPLPVVGVGGSYQMNAAPLRDTPYVASDNTAIVRLAYEHLIEMGLQRFALYSIEPTPRNRWAQERESAFRRLVEADGMTATVFNGMPTHALDWDSILTALTDWLLALPKPVGVIAVTDSRARQVLQACIMANIAVPEEIAIIGVDDDPLIRMLSRIPISSVAQGARKMGQLAAEMLHRKLIGASIKPLHMLTAPEGVNAQASTEHRPFSDIYVMKARHYIRLFAAQGIKAGQLAERVGVSRATLDAHFLRETGHTAHEELLRFKLELSQNLLESGLTCAEVAHRSGFTSLPYMYAVYRRELGCTPLDYQSLHARESGQNKA